MNRGKDTKRWYVVKRTSPTKLKVVSRPLKDELDANAFVEWMENTKPGEYLKIQCEGYDKTQL